MPHLPLMVMLATMSDITQLLVAAGGGDRQAAAQLLPLVYNELRRLAAARLAGESPGQTLQATALVHEAYLRLVVNQPQHEWNGRGHFFAAAAEAMRRILVDNARRRQCVKHGGGMRRIELLEAVIAADPAQDEQILLLDESLTRLASVRPQAAKLIQLRFFSGVSVEEAAPMLGLSSRTARRLWAFARAWLRRDMDRATNSAS